MRKREPKIIYQHTNGCVTKLNGEYTVWEYNSEGRLIEGFEVPTLDEGIAYLKELSIDDIGEK